MRFGLTAGVGNGVVGDVPFQPNRIAGLSLLDMTGTTATFDVTPGEFTGFDLIADNGVTVSVRVTDAILTTSNETTITVDLP